MIIRKTIAPTSRRSSANRSPAPAVLALAAFAASAASATVTVSNVTFTQDAATHEVTINYDLATSDGEPAFVSLDVLTNGVSVGATRVRTLSGDVSTTPADTASLVAPGTGKQIVWKARADLPGVGLDNATVRVTALGTNHYEGLYLVVDLSRGKDSTYWPVQYTACKPDLNSPLFYTTELWLRRVPAGTFAMGYGTSGEPAPVHDVTLSRDFYCAVVPTTRAQHLNIRVKNTAGDYWPNGEGLDDNGDPFDYYPFSKDVSYNEIRGSHWPTNMTVATSTVVGRLRSKTGLKFDIPTEAQWEYACRAGHSGNTLNDGSSASNDGYQYLGWGQINSGWVQNTSTADHWHPVARLKPSDWDFYDFYGNVLEWCRDWYAAYSSAAVTDPTGPDTGTYRISRGGSYALNASANNSYYRRHNVGAGNHDNNTGYRLVVETEEGDPSVLATGADRGFADSTAGYLETRPAATLAGVRAGSDTSYIDTATGLAFTLIVR